jgi:hypothetical protein
MADLSITAADVHVVEIVEQVTAPAAEAITAGQAVRYDTTTGKLTLAKGTDAAEARVIGVALKSAATGITLTALKRGVMDIGDALGSYDYDAAIYLSDTDGTLATTTGTVATTIGRVDPAFGHTTPDKLLRVEL